jgi:hypothetical protein
LVEGISRGWFFFFFFFFEEMASIPLTNSAMANFPLNKVTVLIYQAQINLIAYIPLAVSQTLS